VFHASQYFTFPTFEEPTLVRHLKAGCSFDVGQFVVLVAFSIPSSFNVLFDGVNSIS
jgi:hypothetical protein